MPAKKEASTFWDTISSAATAGHVRRAWTNSKKPYAKRPRAVDREMSKTSSRKSTTVRAAGLNTSSTVRIPCSNQWMAGYDNACAESVAEDTRVQNVQPVATINAGQSFTSPSSG